MDIHPYVIQSRSELGSTSYILMEKDFAHKSISTYTICRNFIWMKNWFYITICSEKSMQGTN